MDRILSYFRSKPTVAVLRLEGMIGAARLGMPALSDASLAPLIDAAFKRGKPKAVALVVNSPGGSPAQSSLIAARIRRLADEKSIPVYAFCEDVAASGGYWLATAADQIYVDPNSILGSIGVISASFGFHEFLTRQGVERRVHTAGEDKSLLDPFRPERPEDVERLKRLQVVIHDNFIAQVRARRGDRLQGDNLFSGEIWVGRAPSRPASPTVSTISCRRCGRSTARTCASACSGSAARSSAGSACPASSGALGELEARALWSRYGLNAP
jgi:signal peptide peptidase SppA